ncbi:uncharacterized protein LOC120424717 [Culex pipiens pallens]|uniref:uncharacterized protein LOC120424717 n=1 Tax=Culex pipiens pallens TaxID=42434 RepID=UPI001952DF6B|nr:uncharacterized protein LOC120424717 [Culex pipiens pallens]
MNISTKTGLIASPRKHIVRPRKEFDPAVLAPCAITRQVPLALRPFGGLYNPYSKGCSVLCNHPAAQELKNVVRLAKDAWITDARTVHSEKLLMGGQGHGSGKQPDGSKRMMSKDSDLPDHVPEEFFRRYTDTDSRPLTPTPTVASGRTRASVVGGSHLTRRCVTPEPQTQNLQERKQLILDLRRSHSQETLYWNASSELSPSQLQDPSWMQHHSQIPETVDERVLGGDGAESDKEDRQGKPTPMTCINAMEDGEEDPPRRRGKRRKKSKQLPQTISFTPNQDPETAVATIDPDSPNYSARPSLVPTGRSLLSSGAESPPRASVEEQIEYIECFLDDEALCLLRRGLNIDIVESVFERYKARAMREAFRTATTDKLDFQSRAVKQLEETLDIHDIDHEKWIDLPRKYSRSSARFELPMDTRTLSTMTPIEYLKRHVVLCDDRKKLFHRIFCRNLPSDDGKPNQEFNENDSIPETETPVQLETFKNLLADVTRLIPMANFDKAMHEALGFHGTPEKIFEIRELLELNYEYYQEIPIDFRSWCGIVAFAERFIITQDRELDPCNELEMVDFESMERRIRSAKPSENLCKVLHIIKSN